MTIVTKMIRYDDLRSLRELTGTSQAKLAAELGTYGHKIHRLEKRNDNAPMKDVLEYLRALGYVVEIYLTAPFEHAPTMTLFSDEDLEE
jgi:hypothetical protein